MPLAPSWSSDTCLTVSGVAGGGIGIAADVGTGEAENEGANGAGTGFEPFRELTVGIVDGLGCHSGG